MRTKVSGKKKLITVVIASIILLASIIFIAWKMSSLTRNFLNNDNIGANVDCVGIIAFDDDNDVKEIIKTKAPGVEVDETLIEEINKNNEYTS